VGVASAVFVIGLALTVPLVVRYVSNDWRLPGGIDPEGYLAVLGVTAMIAAFITFTNTLLLHAVLLPRPRGLERR
jgi:hypothetical protein